MSTEEKQVTNFVSVGAVADYEDGQLYNHKIDGVYVAVVRRGERFYAMKNQCTHAGYFFTPGTLYEGKVHCPAHGAFFDLESGEPVSGPADDSLQMWTVRIEDGDVLVSPPK